VCNGSLRALTRRSVASLVPARVRERHDKFARCTVCGRIYWPGTHTLRIRKALHDASIDLSPRVPLPPSPRMPWIVGDRAAR